MTWIEPDQLIAILTLVSAILVPILTEVLRSRKKSLQMAYQVLEDRKETVVSIRNAGSRTIFLDKLLFHKTRWIEYDITNRFCHDAGKSITIGPGEALYSAFSERDLDEILCRAKDEGKVDKYWFYSEFRLAFKMIVESSEGVDITQWFKIGHQRGTSFCKIYDFCGRYKPFYGFKTKRSISLVYYAIVPTLLLGIGFSTESEGWSWGLYLILVGYIAAIYVASLYASDGLPNRISMMMVSGGILLLSMCVFWAMSKDISFTLIFTFMAMSCIPSMARCSGWDM